MKNLLLILLTSLSLTGCFYQTIDANDIETATKKCAQVDSKVVSISALFIGDESVICSNRAKYFF